MKRTESFFRMSCLMLMGFILPALSVPAQAVDWTYYDGQNALLVTPTDDEIEKLAAKRVSGTDTHFALRIGHDFTRGLGTGYLENIGNPSPGVGLSWVPKDQKVAATVNGTVIDIYNMGIRYVVTGLGGYAPLNSQFKATALQFDGSNDYADANLSLGTANTSMVIQFYAKRNRLNVEEMIFSQGTAEAGKGIEIGFASDNRAVFSVYGYDPVYASITPDTMEHFYKFEYTVKNTTYYTTNGNGYNVKIYFDNALTAEQDIAPDCKTTQQTVPNIVDGCYEIVGCPTGTVGAVKASENQNLLAFKDLPTAKNHWNSGSIQAWVDAWTTATIPRSLCADNDPTDGCGGNSDGNVYCRGAFVPDVPDDSYVSGKIGGPCYNKWYSTVSGKHAETRRWADIWKEIKRQGTGNPATEDIPIYSCASRIYASSDTTLDIGRGISGKYFNGQLRDAEVILNGTSQAKWAFKDGGTSTTAADSSGNNRTATLKNFTVSVAWITDYVTERTTPLSVTEGNQTIEFTMTAPAKLIYKWETQYAVTVNSLPSTVTSSYIYTNGSARHGNGKFWFSPGTFVDMYGGSGSCLQLRGYRDNANPTVTVSSSSLSKTLTEPFGITWIYGNYLYQETVTIGSPVSLATIPQAQREIINSDQKPNYVSTSVPENDMCVWSDFEKKMYPLRGGESFDLEFPLNDPNCPEKKINLRVIAIWPPTPHYIHVAETPPVNLDPLPDDSIAFLGMKHTEENTEAAMSGTNFTASGKGRSSLLFTRTFTDVINPKDISLQFNGQNGYLELTPHQGYLGNSSYDSTTNTRYIFYLTVSFWAKVKGNSGKERTVISNLFDSGYYWGLPTPLGFNIGVSVDERWHFTYYNGTNTPVFDIKSNANVPYDEWVYVTAQISSSQDYNWAFLFINGVREAEVTTSQKFLTRWANSNDRLRIGTNTKAVIDPNGLYYQAGTNYFNGQIDDITFWNTALSEKDIRSNMDGYLSFYPERFLTGYYRFDKPGSDSVENSTVRKNEIMPPAKLINMDPVNSYVSAKELSPGATAKGDLTSEYVYVRVAETRNRDDDKVPGNATVGRELFSVYHDPNAANDGYVFYELGPYNPDIYDRANANGAIYPVNIHHPDPEGMDTLLVVWYKVQDSISWPYQPVEYTLSWPPVDDPEQYRIVIASRFGSEGKNFAGNTQRYADSQQTDPASLDNVQNYFDPARYKDIKIYNQPDPSKIGYNPNEEHALTAPSLRHASASPRPVAGYALRNDLNITTPGDTYTSDPFVLVQYYDEIRKRGGMQIYKVEKDDPAAGYTFRYDMKAGEPVEAPYPLNTVIGATPPNEIFGKNGNPAQKCYWEDHKGQPWAISGAGKQLEIESVVYSNNAYDITIKPEEPFLANQQYTVSVDVSGFAGSMKFQVGVSASKGNTDVYVNGGTVQATQFTVYLTPDIIGLTKNNFTLVHYSSDAHILSYFWYPLDPSFWISTATPGNGTGEVGKSLPWLPSGTVAAADGFPADMTGKDKAVEVRYDVSWPSDVPILKAGETLTFPGGEYRADNNTEGLPGVLGWAAGQVVFDELNPKMDTSKMFTDYLARLVPVLEERTVSLPMADFPADLLPATGRTEVMMGRWYFKFLNAGLKTRIFYDPLTGKLGIQGFVNDKTLGDKTLTASPPAVYVVQPNILTLSEKNDIQNLEGANAQFKTAVAALYGSSRNPFVFPNQTFTVGLDTYKRLTETYKGQFYQNWMASMIASFGDSLTADPTQPIPQVCLGPGLALIPNGDFLNPSSAIPEGYMTLAENNHPDMGALPVALHIVKVKKDKYRGAIKPILSENVFDEKITLRHTADFGANPDDLVFQWWYREEDGTNQPTPDVDALKWKAFPDLRGTASIPGQGMTEIAMTGAGAALLTDNLFYARYRHKDSEPEEPASWSNWAGAANSRPGSYQAQLCEGWVKRVLFAINPFEARVKNFYNSDNPATYISMIQQAGARYEGAVAFNPAKDVIENVGLIELYQTVLNRAADLSINLSQPASTSGVTSALLLAASRVADFYLLLGNEAYTDALDPTIAIGSDSTEYGSLAPTIFTFMNQEPGLLDEELSLLRGKSELGARPSYNRLLWNFTNGQGEVAYALSYNIQDMNKNGFINEEDGRTLYPQGHGDAWGHYLTAIKGYYDLLTHPYFNWESRAEKVNIQGVVIDVDYLDERKFAEAAASKAKVGKDLINLTYRSKYTENPEGQWQGYQDTDKNRAWGVTEWGRRAFTGAYCDWLVGNAILPAEDTDENHNPIQKVDRTTVGELMEIASQAREIHQEYDNANTGLNPIGLVTDAVPFDINPGVWGVPGQNDNPTHFEQIYDRADAAMKNARVIFNHANDLKNRIRSIGNTAAEFSNQVEDQDRDYRNCLIEIFGTPYEGTIGAGKTYPAGYKGPDYFYYNYIDVNEISDETVPPPSDYFKGYFTPMAKEFVHTDGEAFDDLTTAFSHFFNTDLGEGDYTALITQQNADQILPVDFPTAAAGYSFQTPEEWGIRRAPGEIQQALTELVKAEADVMLALADYSGLLVNIDDALILLKAADDLNAEELRINDRWKKDVRGFNAGITASRTIAATADVAAEASLDIAKACAEGLPKSIGLSNDPSFIGRLTVLGVGQIVKYSLKGVAVASNLAADITESEKEIAELSKDMNIQKAEYSYEVQQKLKEIEELLWDEMPMRMEIFKRRETMRQVSEKYRSVLEKGLRLMEERKAFNARVSSKTQGNRYLDMAFRLSMNDALSKYRNMFDMASRYVYLAAKAYDYETNLADTDSASAKILLKNIVQKRTLGEYRDGQYIIGQGGLGDVLAKMKANFNVLKTQMGFNNPQTETDRFSLRSELFRITKNASKDRVWRNKLENCKVANLWNVPEFRRFCRPFTAESTGAQPGLVIPFSTNVIFGKNFFGWPLSGGDHAYDPTNFATKVRSVGLWFEGYDNTQLAETPRAYLIPVGMDIMLVPNSYSLDTREWTIADQKIPVPLPLDESSLKSPDWIPSLDSTDGSMIEIRRYSSFRAYHDKGYFDTSEMSYDSRLIGRSVWNTRWLLIIPGGTFLADSKEGLATFIHGKTIPGTTTGERDGNGVKDIKLFFQTYAISGN